MRTTRRTNVRTSKRHRPLLWILVSLAVLVAWSGTALSQERVTAYTNATVYTLVGEEGTVPLEGASVVIHKGKIVDVLPSGQKPPSDAEIVDVEGQIITPGFIDVATGLGLVEVNAVSATRHGGTGEGKVRAGTRAVDAFDPEVEAIEVTRRGGVTSVGVHPSGGVISGQAVHCTLSDGQTAREMCTPLVDGAKPEAAPGEKSDDGYRPSYFYTRIGASAGQGSRGTAIGVLRAALDDALLYGSRAEDFDGNRLRELSIDRGSAEALGPVFGDGAAKPKLFIEADRAVDIDAALALRADFGVDVVIVGGASAHERIEDLTEAKVTVVVDAMQNAPESFDTREARSDNAALLVEGGATVVFSTFGSHNVRNLRQVVGNAIRGGVLWEQGLVGVTRAAAQVLGVDTQVGQLARGFDANLVVWSGDPFEISSHAVRVIIRGAAVRQDTRQDALLEKYRP